MYSLGQQIVHFIEDLSSTCGQFLLSTFDSVTAHPWISIAAGILGYIGAMRTMCR